MIKKFFIFLVFLFFGINSSIYAIECRNGLSGCFKEDKSGKPLGDVNITVFLDGKPSIHTSRTRKDGCFDFPYPLSGNIYISATKNGYKSLASVITYCSGFFLVMEPQSIPTPPPGSKPRCGTSCATSEQCRLASDGCTYCDSGICIDPKNKPPLTPATLITPPSSEKAINFGRLSGAIPSLKPIFQPGPASNVGGIISAVLPYLLVIAGLLLLFYLIYGGFRMMISANNPEGLKEAKGKITNALVGFLLLFLSYWLVQIVEVIFGITIF